MSDTVAIRIGNILKSPTEEYRIIGLKHGIVALCKMNTHKLDILHKKADEIKMLVFKKEWTIASDKQSIVIDTASLSDQMAEKYKQDCSIVNKVNQRYGPMFESLKYDYDSRYIGILVQEYGYSRKTIWKIIRKWLQSGMDYASLLDRRHLRYAADSYVYADGKTRRNHFGNNQHLSDKDLEHIDKYFKIYKSNAYLSVKDAYLDMCNEFYRTSEKKDDELIFHDIDANAPSYQQFLRYCNNQLTPAEKDAIRMKAREQRNSKRILTGSSMTNVAYAGQVAEIDEVDNPVSLVSVTDPSITVGRPNTYAMIDVKSRVVLAIGVAFNQNSYVGLTNMMVNLCEDKVEYCKKYGIEIKPEDWPSCIIPASFRTDRGSDFKGNDFLKVCQRLNIERNLEPAATGSLKGVVENLFRTIQPQERSLYQNVGQITKDYDSKHHEEAMLNVYEYTRNLILLVIKHNKRSMENYPLSAEMIAKGIRPIPCELWKYFVENVQAPMPIQNKESYLVALMKDGHASVNRKGIHFLKRTYFPEEDDAELYMLMYQQQQKSARIDIKFDPRNMDHIYQIRNNKMIILTMSQNKPENEGFFGLTEDEIMILNHKALEIRKNEKQHNRQTDADTRLFAKEGVSNAYKDLKPSSKDLREHRKDEKLKVAQANYDIASRLGVDSVVHEEPQPPLESADSAELKKPAPEYIESQPDNIEDDLFAAIGKVNSK